jgi:hypothetical protein
MTKLVKVSDIKGLILELRGQKVMLDRDLAMIYGVKPIRLREQVKRNKERFPEDFMFQLNEYEIKLLVSQNAIPSFKILGGYKPYAFTRNGANMLSTVLRSPVAIKRSIQIMRAFSILEEAISRKKKTLAQSPEILKKLSTHSRAIMQLFQEIKVKGKKIDKVWEIQEKMKDLLQQIIISSIGKE